VGVGVLILKYCIHELIDFNCIMPI